MYVLATTFEKASLILSIISIITATAVALYVVFFNKRYDEKKTEKEKLSALLKELSFLHYQVTGVSNSLNLYLGFQKGIKLAEQIYQGSVSNNLEEKERRLNEAEYDKPEFIQEPELIQDIDKELRSFMSAMEKVQFREFTVELSNVFHGIYNVINYEIKYYWDNNKDDKLIKESLSKLHIYIDNLKNIYDEKKEELDNLK